jgi:pimeloyl-ACP methyl ester carboxylesterase
MPLPPLLVSLLLAQAPASPLKPCSVPNLQEEVRCGTYEVWENREQRAGRKIPLNIVVIPALAAKPKPDPLFVLVGGPGQGATDGAAGDAQRFAAIRKERAIVLLDQRGAGQSNPLHCDLGGDPNALVGLFTAGVAPPEAARACRDQLEKKADLRHYTTTAFIHDLDEVRAWLGYEQVNLYGGSYGSRAALEYLRRYPKRVRTATIRAVDVGGPLEAARDAQDALDKLLDDCAKEEACAKAYPNLRADLDTLLRRIEEKPVVLKSKNRRTGAETDVVITRDVLAGGIMRWLADPGAARQVPLGIQRFLAGDFSGFETVVARVTGLGNALALGLNISVNCAEWGAHIQEGQIAAAVRGTVFGGARAQGLLNICKVWPRGAAPADIFDPIRADNPVLILSGAIDPQTPPRHGEKAARTLPNSLHLIMEGIAHGPFPSCAVGIMAEFVDQGSVKGLDTSCLKSLRRQPFALPR